MKRHTVSATVAAIVAAAPVFSQPVRSNLQQGYSQSPSGRVYIEPNYVEPAQWQPGYGSQNPISQVIDQLLSDRYRASDHQAVSVCASAALNQAAAQFSVNGYSGYSGGYTGSASALSSGVRRYPVNPAMRVTSITDIQPNNGGLRIKGMIESGMTHAPFRGSAYQGTGPAGQPYADRHPTANDLSFRCNVDQSGRITSLRVEGNTTTYRRY